MQESDKLVSIEFSVGDDGQITRATLGSLYQVTDDAGNIVVSTFRTRPYEAEDPQVETALGLVASGLSVQVNALQGQLDDAHGQTQALNRQVQALQDALDQATPADPAGIQAQVRQLVQQELANATPAGTWWERFLGLV